ncbi:MAG: SpoIID/LytB domain-containing protein [Lachnospiraceae bacterium]|nr:SpoIID/LytB domain-containing protein [Lachnospiraceae bacterium]
MIVLIWITISLGIYQCSVQSGGIHMEKTETDVIKETETEAEEEEDDDSAAADWKKSVSPFGETVRILLKNQGYQGIYHTELILSCSEGMIVDDREKIVEYEPDSEYILRADDRKDNAVIKISSKNDGRIHIKNIGRNSSAQYRGFLECYFAPEGIVVINELPVEEYLYGVVPSEMPPSYPEEALKAQAVSARTYTYFHKQTYAYPQWNAHMDDSTSFQVYMNCEEMQSACNAVDSTKGQVLTFGERIVESFYYSTSGGFNGGAGVWKDYAAPEDEYLIETGNEQYALNNEEGEAAYREYIDNGNAGDVEYYESWYRWDYSRELNDEAVRKLLQKLYNLSVSQPQKVRIRSQYLPSDQLIQEKEIKDIRVLSRRKSGLVTALMIETEHFRVSIMSQHTIRQALGCAGETVTKNDGSSYTMGDILPSAYFYIQNIYDNNTENGDNLKKIEIHGAGLGHGCGMSQNGAKCLAERGLTAAQILAYYYNGSIKDVNELELAAD